MTMCDFFDRGVRIAPDRLCYVHDDGSNAYSYAEIHELTHRIAAGLAAEAADARTFAVYSPNHSLVFCAILGGQRGGLEWISLNARSGVDEIAYILDRCRCDVLFVHSQFEDHIPLLKRKAPSLKAFIGIDRATAHGPDLISWSAAHPARAPDIVQDSEAICALINTGGTTGKPKAAKISNRSMSTMAAAGLTYLHFDEPPVYMVVAPLSHVAGAVGLPLLAMAATNVIATEISPARILSIIEDHRVTIGFLPPTLIYLLLAEPDIRTRDYSSLKYLLYAAAPMAPAKIAEAMAVFGPVLIQAYGQTEVPMWMTCMTPHDHVVALADPEKIGRLASCGRPTPYGRLEIMDDDGYILGPDKTGEIVYRGALLMSGYHRAAKETREARLHGWHHTGDVGYRSADGFIYIIDRKKEMIISGGFNIYPAEIEKAILSHPAVHDCAVIGVPDDKWGEAVAAVLELKKGRDVAPDEIIRLCKAKLGSLKAPKSVTIWPELPLTAVGKVARRAVRDHFWQDRERKI